MTTKRKLAIGVSILVVVVAVATAAYFYLSETEVPLPEPEIHYSQLTGEEVEADVAERPILGVIIENTPAARPQTGLADAGIVIEILTEGGITRTLALYQEDMPDVVGPIRSLRPYFVEAVAGFDASVAHVGGSGEALQMVKDKDIKSLDQFRYSDPYYRSDDRVAPHNMYAQTQDLRELQDELDHGRSSFGEIPRSKDNPSEEPVVSNVTIEFSGPDYEVEFRYQKADNSYVRYLAGESHLDAVSGRPVTVNNVVVVLLPGNGEAITGTGDALIFKDGKVFEKRWQKEDFDDRISMVNEEGRQIRLNKGKTWFAVIPDDKPVRY